MLAFCDSQGLASTKLQKDTANIIKRKLEYDFWRRGIKKNIQGFRDAEFDALFVRFIDDCKFDDLKDDQKQLLFSYALQFNRISKKAQDFIFDWFEKQTGTRPEHQKGQLDYQTFKKPAQATQSQFRVNTEPFSMHHH